MPKLSPAQQAAVELGRKQVDRRIFPSAISIRTAACLERAGVGEIVSRGMRPCYTITGKPNGYVHDWYFQLNEEGN